MGMGHDLLKEGRSRVKGHGGSTTGRSAPAPDELNEVGLETDWLGHHATVGDQGPWPFVLVGIVSIALGGSTKFQKRRYYFHF